jgi:protein involved in ribonucleotide reduction
VFNVANYLSFRRFARRFGTITHSTTANRHHADIQIITNGTAVVTRAASGSTREEVEAAVAAFLKSEEARRLEGVYGPNP